MMLKTSIYCRFQKAGGNVVSKLSAETLHNMCIYRPTLISFRALHVGRGVHHS